MTSKTAVQFKTRLPAEMILGFMQHELVLLVEAFDPLSRMIIRSLQSAGYDCVRAVSSGDALRLLPLMEVKPIAAIVNIDDGEAVLQVVERVREDKPEARLLFTTGGKPNREALAQVKRGEAALLRKPFTEEALISRFASELQRPVRTGIPDGMTDG